MSMENSNYIIGNRTRDLPACSAVPQPTATPRAPNVMQSGAYIPCDFQSNQLYLHKQQGTLNSKYSSITLHGVASRQMSSQLPALFGTPIVDCWRQLHISPGRIIYHYKLVNTRQHNKHLLEYTGYMFRPVNRSSLCLQQSKSQVLF